MLVAGVDGCRAGWFVVLVLARKHAGREPRYVVCRTLREVLSLRPRPAVIAVDIPIGLLQRHEPGGRECDRQARRVLGRPRSSSVFSPPTRPALAAPSWGRARRYRLNRQAFGILPKIREVDGFMTPALQRRVFEVHPEVCFRELAGRAMAHNKKTAQGRSERLKALASIFPPLESTLSARPFHGVAPDDVLDAHAAAWSAVRIAEHRAETMPPNPPVDAKGFRMEIVY